MNQVSKPILEQLKGRELSAVTFVRDYLQLHFDGPFLNVFVWPQIKIDGTMYCLDSVGYRDALCTQIGKIVGGAVVQAGTQVSLFFADGSIIQISLLSRDRQGPEALLFQGEDGSFGVW
jgi:hypothetical protein